MSKDIKEIKFDGNRKLFRKFREAFLDRAFALYPLGALTMCPDEERATEVEALSVVLRPIQPARPDAELITTNATHLELYRIDMSEYRAKLVKYEAFKKQENKEINELSYELKSTLCEEAKIVLNAKEPGEKTQRQILSNSWKRLVDHYTMDNAGEIQDLIRKIEDIPASMDIAELTDNVKSMHSIIVKMREIDTEMVKKYEPMFADYLSRKFFSTTNERVMKIVRSIALEKLTYDVAYKRILAELNRISDDLERDVAWKKSSANEGSSVNRIMGKTLGGPKDEVIDVMTIQLKKLQKTVQKLGKFKDANTIKKSDKEKLPTKSVEKDEKERTCFNCGEKGHYVNDCEAKFCGWCRKHNYPEPHNHKSNKCEKRTARKEKRSREKQAMNVEKQQLDSTAAEEVDSYADRVAKMRKLASTAGVR